MRTFLILYKFIYCAVLALIAAVVLQGGPFESITTKPKALALCGYVLVLTLTGAVAVALGRVPRTIVWASVILFVAFFTWHGWFGPGGFFIQTEGHTFDPTAAAIESAKFTQQAAISYALMMVWFLSLPVVRQFTGNMIGNGAIHGGRARQT